MSWLIKRYWRYLTWNDKWEQIKWLLDMTKWNYVTIVKNNFNAFIIWRNIDLLLYFVIMFVSSLLLFSILLKLDYAQFLCSTNKLPPNKKKNLIEGSLSCVIRIIKVCSLTNKQEQEDKSCKVWFTADV